ncbi:hypothetical protein [Parahaliea mediterranea]|uniref:Uncharacterized protein n=1 Tax=Parahaliea mediterranea TaxID=651086 RepID=A0A939IIA3_9GAMM|nr:hypothetical protein [Parahaliea mediterranea]MBN7796394.1 hypothetical protein [Parahaliea mediterranea]
MRQTRLVWLCLVLLASGCGGERSMEFCERHGAEHWQHRAEVTVLDMQLDEVGVLNAVVTIPRGALDWMPAGQVLASAANVVDAGPTCAPQAASVTRDENALLGEYRLQCSGDAPPAGLTVALFQHLDELREVEVTMTTPAVSKHFLVNRRCERALFNVLTQREGM